MGVEDHTDLSAVMQDVSCAPPDDAHEVLEEEAGPTAEVLAAGILSRV